MRPLNPLVAVALRGAARAASRSGRSASLLVLIYHRVVAVPDSLLGDEPDAERFAGEMDLLNSLFNVLGFSEAAERLATGSLPPRAVAITFDDGYANNLEFAAPILAARGMTATFFISTGFIDGGMMWNDKVIEAARRAPVDFDLTDLGFGRFSLPDVPARRRAIEELLGKLKYLGLEERVQRAEAIAERAGVSTLLRPMMAEHQLRQLASLGMEIGAHTVTHPILARLPAGDARRQIADSRQRLESIVGVPVTAFAYPNGRPGRDYGPEHVQMVKDAGFACATSTAWGAATLGGDRFQIPRVAPWDRSPGKYALRLVRGFTERNPATV